MAARPAARCLALLLTAAIAGGCPVLRVRPGWSGALLSGKDRDFELTGVREQRPEYRYHDRHGIEHFRIDLFWEGGRWVVSAPQGPVATLKSEALTPHNATGTWKAYDARGRKRGDPLFKVECARHFEVEDHAPHEVEDLHESIVAALKDPEHRKNGTDHSAYLKAIEVPGMPAPPEGLSGMYVQVVCPYGETCLTMGGNFLAHNRTTSRWVLARRGGVLATAAMKGSPIASIPPYIADDGEVMLWEASANSSLTMKQFYTEFHRPEAFRARCKEDCVRDITVRCKGQRLCEYQAGLSPKPRKPKPKQEL